MASMMGVMVMLLLAVASASCGGPWDYQTPDAFDEINYRITSINARNCQKKSRDELHLPEETLSHLPRFNRLLTTTFYRNRTNLVHLHNMALNRAFFFSYVFQKLDSAETFRQQPGLMYYYYSSAAMVSANEYNINASAVMFDQFKSYANFVINLKFNTTLPRFGPRVWRDENYNNPRNWLREPNNNTLETNDYGAGQQIDYTAHYHKTNQWYHFFLPDSTDTNDRKHPYDVGIMYSDKPGTFRHDTFESFTFHGPASPGQTDTDPDHLPVVFTQPYFDCGRSDKWIVSAVSPIVDYLPRYLNWTHIRRHRYVAVATVDIDFKQIDFNPCPISIGNELPNIYAGTARCRPTTRCEPVSGWGFRRGGYQCVCQPGYRLPDWQDVPFQGGDIESATEKEYNEGFYCLPVQQRIIVPVLENNMTDLLYEAAPSFPSRQKRHVTDRELEDHVTWTNSVLLDKQGQKGHTDNVASTDWKSHWQPQFVRQHNTRPVKVTKDDIINHKMTLKSLAQSETLSRDNPPEATRNPESPKIKFTARYDYEKPRRRNKRAIYTSEHYKILPEIMEQKNKVNRKNCHEFDDDALRMSGDVAFRAEELLSPQARSALRLAHFLSDYLQNVDKQDDWGVIRGDPLFNVELLFAEVLSNVMGDLKIKGSGIFFERDMFQDEEGRRSLFGPYAYRQYINEVGEEMDQASDIGEVVKTQYRAVDYAGFQDHYITKPWFHVIKQRFASNLGGIYNVNQKMRIRSDLNGTSLLKHLFFPTGYKVPREYHGEWSEPYFNCNGFVNDWIVTYSVPFFGLSSLKSGIKFYGVVTVDVRLDELDIHQCNFPYHVPNIFKGTHKCDKQTTYCVQLPGRRFTAGAYKCLCKQGYEYPMADNGMYYDGQTVEKEYQRQLLGQKNRYNTLKCRLAGGPSLTSSAVLMTILVILSFLK